MMVFLAASLPEQQAAEEQGDWQVLLEAGAQGRQDLGMH